MQTTRTDPPYIPLRSSGWPARRAPKWVFAAAAVLLAIGVAIGLAHHPTAGQRATDLHTFLHELTTDVQSCSGGVRESLYVLRQIDRGASHDMTTATSVARTAAANCSPANNQLLEDLTTVQPTESLASYHLGRAVTALIDWAAPRAGQVAADVVTVLASRGQPGEAAARAALAADQRKLDRQRTVVDRALAPAIRAIDPAAKPPVLYG
ncbi:MAG TPA: hypothetical protein VF843_13675 [Streptosporangiaceae bacterium]